MGYWQKRISAFGHAFRGIGTFFRESPHARIHALAALLVTLAGFRFDLSQLEWVAIMLCFALVLSLEAINSALEYAVDLSSPDKHPLAKKAKDVAAAAVLLAALFTIIIAALIFVPKI